jgi:hypothetical protein
MSSLASAHSTPNSGDLPCFPLLFFRVFANFGQNSWIFALAVKNALLFTLFSQK